MLMDASQAVLVIVDLQGRLMPAIHDAGLVLAQNLRLAKIAAVVSPVSGIATQVSFLAVLGVGGLRVASGSLSIAASD